jgi:PAS domain S-box-containing protein
VSFKAKVAAAFGASLLTLLAVGFLSYQGIVAQNEDQKWVIHTHSVLESIDTLQEELSEAETDQRDYIIGGEETFLSAYRDVVSQVNTEELSLRDLIGENSLQQQLWSQLTVQISLHLNELQKAIDIRSGKGLTVASVMPPGTQKRDEITGLLTKMKVVDQQLVSERAERASASAQNMQIVIVTGEILAFVFLFGAGILIRHEMEKRKRTEQGLRESEERFRLMVSEVRDYAILMLDLEGYIISWNAGAERITGYKPDEILNTHFSIFFPSEDIAAGKPAFELEIAAKRGRFVDESWRVRKEGTKFWASVVITALHDEHGQLRGFAKVTRDITERKKSEEALKESESRLTLALDSAQMGVWDIDLKSGTVVRSLRHDQIFGYSALQQNWTVDTLMSHIIPDDQDMLKEKFTEATFTGHFRIECRIAWPDLSIRWIALRGRVHRNEYGGPVRMMGVVVDITEFKRAQDQLVLRTAELEGANKELEAFCYSVSHDLRAPLRAIDGFTHAVFETCSRQLDDVGKDYLERVMLAAGRMGALIDDLLNLSRVTRVEIAREAIDFSELGQSIASELQRTDPKRKVEFVIAPNLRAEGDPRLLRTVLENLIGNCWKFTSKREYAQIEFGRESIDGTKAFFVRDNGVGFDPRYASRLFGTFQRLHAANEFPGTGIGLASAQRIIQRHGGRIWADAAVGEGATFYFTLLGPQKVIERDISGLGQPPGERVENGEPNYLVSRR